MEQYKFKKILMEYECYNCNNFIQLPDIIYKGDEYVCDECMSYISISPNLYKKCTYCHSNVLIFYSICPECNCEEVRLPISQYISSSGLDISLSELSTPKYIYIKNEREYKYAMQVIQNLDILAVDTEGNTLDPYEGDMFLIQIGNEEIIFVFDFLWFTELSRETFWSDITKLFILHNAKFDYKFIKHFIGVEIENLFDTYLAERLLTCGINRENSLKAVAFKYLGIDLDKKIRMDFINMRKDNFHELVYNELLEYSARDVVVLPFIYRIQKILLQNENMEDIADIEFKATKALGDMELKGIYVDIEKWKSIIEKNQIEKEKVENEIYKFIKTKEIELSSARPKENLLLEIAQIGEIKSTQPELNLNSTHILKKIFKSFDIELEDTGDLTLASLHHPLADLIREYRGYEKQLSAFGQRFLNLVKDTHRVHPSFNQIGADTGRMSCNNPNMQQIPATEEYRGCFTAPPSRKIVTCDYSQQELRLLASLSGDPKFIKMYEDGVDLHSATASLMYNIPLEEVPKDKRSAAKTINFGLAYGRGAKALAEFLGISKEEGEEMIRIYFSQFSYIGDWLNNAAKVSQDLGYSTTLFGRKRYYKKPSERDPEYNSIMARIGRQGKNSPIQGSGADMAKLALVRLREKLRHENIDAFLINAVHDEIVIEASEKDAPRALEILEESMIEAGQAIVNNVPILAEGGVYDFWKH